ncbi:MAG: hypothetical protein PHY90_01505 [Desulfitobacteriaceae bacterium]|nr:hypothetical protein [Desulfitobacteriaceae bacterium]
MKIKDRILLGVIAGTIGNTVKTVIDEVSLRKNISQRSFRETAAGVWVSKQSEASNIKGQILGGLFDFGLGSLGGIGIVHMLSKTGKDQLITKGILSGISIGSTVTALLSAFPQNKVKPKDAASNLSYMFSHAVYGIVTTYLVTGLGHPSLFDAKPLNDYLPPKELTTEQQNKSKSNSMENKELLTE